jgi:hypothetical protein
MGRGVDSIDDIKFGEKAFWVGLDITEEILTFNNEVRQNFFYRG